MHVILTAIRDEFSRIIPRVSGIGPVWTEITRQRIFVEPPLFVFGTFALWSVYRHAQGLRNERRLRPSVRRE